MRKCFKRSTCRVPFYIQKICLFGPFLCTKVSFVSQFFLITLFLFCLFYLQKIYIVTTSPVQKVTPVRRTLEGNSKSVPVRRRSSGLCCYFPHWLQVPLALTFCNHTNNWIEWYSPKHSLTTSQKVCHCSRQEIVAFFRQ